MTQLYSIKIESESGDYENKKKFCVQVNMDEVNFLSLAGAILDHLETNEVQHAEPEVRTDV